MIFCIKHPCFMNENTLVYVIYDPLSQCSFSPYADFVYFVFPAFCLLYYLEYLITMSFFRFFSEDEMNLCISLLRPNLCKPVNQELVKDMFKPVNKRKCRKFTKKNETRVQRPRAMEKMKNCYSPL
ncbi:hypothetical protein Patl1_03688 [Pistacia atlantica]|uniref:Uncharacterized protein n=1 Tax=Pistacia atlantica TaxID=434234 RepID=A0ACC1BW28_9ROSI|nr:hypothetical protein Patl1_03688 [Pistacia atlantica]